MHKENALEVLIGSPLECLGCSESGISPDHYDTCQQYKRFVNRVVLERRTKYSSEDQHDYDPVTDTFEPSGKENPSERAYKAAPFW